MIFFILAAFCAGWQWGIIVCANQIASKSNARVTNIGILPGILMLVFIILGLIFS